METISKLMPTRSHIIRKPRFVKPLTDNINSAKDLSNLTEETQHMEPQSPMPQFTLIYISQEPIDTVPHIIDG